MKRRRNGLLLGGAIILAVAAVIVWQFPWISQQFYQRKANAVIDSYRDYVDGQDKEDLEWLYQMMVQYNRDLYASGQAQLSDPFSYEQLDFSLVELGFEEEIIGHLEIPRMALNLPVYLGASQKNLAQGAAHLTYTSLPVGGENTNAVIAGHRGMRTVEMFRNIHLLELGDKVYLTNFRETLEYEVTEICIITPDQSEKIFIQEGKDMLTLLSCNPLGANYQRYIVYCTRKGR